MGGNSGSHPSGHARCAVDGASRVDPGRSPFRICLETSLEEAIVDDVSEVISRTRYIMRYPARLFGKGLASELADAVDRLSLKVAELKELEDAGR